MVYFIFNDLVGDGVRLRFSQQSLGVEKFRLIRNEVLDFNLYHRRSAFVCLLWCGCVHIRRAERLW